MPKETLAFEQVRKIRKLRWRARTDLLFLCREILGYKDVCPEVHGPLIDRLQKFPYPATKSEEEQDFWTGSTWRYEPLRAMQDLEGKRRRLILFFRGSLKTTINVQAHSIQWILNYPDIAIAVFQSSGEKAEAILSEIKHHFQYNKKLRTLFPELCPQKRVDDLGTKAEFTIPGRSDSCSRKEPTMKAMSIDKGTAGYHFDLMKFSDIVEPENSKTQERCAAVEKAFYMAENLLVSPVYWIDVEGTRYSFADLYGSIIDRWQREVAKGQIPEYEMFVSGVFKKKTPDGRPQRYTPDELDLPDLLDEHGKRISWWPKDSKGSPRFPLEHLEKQEAADPFTFSCQQLNQPRGGVDGREIFPDSLFATIPVEMFRRNVRISHHDMTVDTAETQNNRSNYSAITVGAWDWAGRCYITKIAHGKWLASELIAKIFQIYQQFRPASVKIEETSFVRGLKPTLEREQELRGIYLPLEFIKRETNISKRERIENTLEPWYRNGLLRFVTNEHDREHTAGLEHLRTEMKTFPLGKTDDIIDTVADLFQNKDAFGRLHARPQTEDQAAQGRKTVLKVAFEQFLGQEPPDWAQPDGQTGAYTIGV